MSIFASSHSYWHGMSPFRLMTLTAALLTGLNATPACAQSTGYSSQTPLTPFTYMPQGVATPQAYIMNLEASPPSVGINIGVTNGVANTPLATLQVGGGTLGGTDDLYIASNRNGGVPLAPAQGAWIEWNANLINGGKNGMTDFINNEGLGTGGWQFINVATNASGTITSSNTPVTIQGTTGYVGIGTTIPTSALSVNGNVGISIGTVSPTYTLTVGGAGTVMATAYYHSSDARLKMDVHPIGNALDKLLAIKGVEFNWKKDGHADMGVIAQNVAEIFPNVVSKDNNGMMSVEYDSLVGPMIEGMRQLKTENDDLKAEVKEIRAEINALQQSNASTHTVINTTVKTPAPVSVIEH